MNTSIWISALTLIASLGIVSTSNEVAAATRLTVFVRNSANQAPLDGAVVCVGTTTNRAAHGRRSTANGVAVFDSVPAGSWIITTWKSNFGVIQRSFVVGSSTPANTAQYLALTSGSAADPCGAPAAPTTRLNLNATTTTAQATPSITSMSINGGAGSMSAGDPVRLALKFSGVATEYRVSEISGRFPESAAAWRPLTQTSDFGGSVRFPTQSGSFATMAAIKRVYLQLRYEGRASNVVSDTITVLARYTAPGMDAVETARQNGFLFLGVTRICAMQRQGNGAEFIVNPKEIPLELKNTYPCTFRLFAGRPLAPGWRLTAFIWSSHYAGRGATLPASGLAAPLLLKGEMRNAVLNEVRLVGPYGSRWQDAFAR